MSSKNTGSLSGILAVQGPQSYAKGTDFASAVSNPLKTTRHKPEDFRGGNPRNSVIKMGTEPQEGTVDSGQLKKDVPTSDNTFIVTEGIVNPRIFEQQFKALPEKIQYLDVTLFPFDPDVTHNKRILLSRDFCDEIEVIAASPKITSFQNYVRSVASHLLRKRGYKSNWPYEVSIIRNGVSSSYTVDATVKEYSDALVICMSKKGVSPRLQTTPA